MLPPPRETGALPDRAGLPRQHLPLADGPRGAEARLVEAGLDDVVEVSSSGTGGWHTGEPDGRAGSRHPLGRRATTPAATGPATSTPAGTTPSTWCWSWTPANLRDVGGAGERVAMFRDFDPDEPGGDGARPVLRWRLPDFEEVLRDGRADLHADSSPPLAQELVAT